MTRKVLTGLDLNGPLTIAGSGGTNGYYLKTDGSGNLSYATPSSISNNYAQTIGTKTNVPLASTYPFTVTSVTITTSGNPVLVTVTGDAENVTAGTWGRAQLFRGTTAIGNDIQYEGSAASENSPYAIHVIDTPAAGTYTYNFKITTQSGGAFNYGENTGPVLTAIELSSLTPSTAITLSSTAPQITLNNGTANLIKMAANGIAAPTFTSYSAGTKIVTFDNLTGSSVGHAIGTESGYMWHAVSDNTNGFKWYAGTTNIATLSGAGALTAGSFVKSSNNASQFLKADGTTAGDRVTWYIPSSGQSIPNSTENAITIWTEQYNTDSTNSFVASISGQTIQVKKAGRYNISALVSWAANATGYRVLRLYVNGSLVYGTLTAPGASVAFQSNLAITEHPLAANDTVEVRVFQNSGGALNIGGSTYISRWSMTYLGAN